jgi:multidrug efflux pump subunit AcrA (membrane-fusion protein)
MRTVALALVAVVVAAAAGAGLWLTRDTWQARLFPAGQSEETAAAADAHPAEPERVKLSPHARANLGLVVGELRPTTYWRKTYLPGTVVDRPGRSDRAVTAPLSGIITEIRAVPGKPVRAKEVLFRMRLISEAFQTSQIELYKAVRELAIVDKQRARLQSLATTGAVPETRLRELEFQHDRLAATAEAHRQDMKARRLTADQIRSIEAGTFITETAVSIPTQRADTREGTPADDHGPGGDYEVQELKVNLGDHVQAGQVLAYLGDHRRLYLEGRALKDEEKLLARAAQEGWPVEAEVADDPSGNRPLIRTGLRIECLGNLMDMSGLTFPVYVPVSNTSTEYTRDGKTYRVWALRPGQRVLLKIAVDRLDDVFVLPIDAVVRDGLETYVFRQNGQSFERRPVHVLHEDREQVVIAADGSLSAGNVVARNAAAALNRALKAQAGGDAPQGHDHHHH